MAGKVKDAANNMFASIGAVQTLVENFPMNLISFGGGTGFSTSFDILAIILAMCGVSNEELVEMISKVLVPSENDEDGSGFIAYAEEVVKVALEANIMNILNCSTNPVISNKLLDSYSTGTGIEEGGEGILLDVGQIDFTGVLSRNPFFEKDGKFYFDVQDYNASTVWKSKDFNAFLWYIINKSDKMQTEERTWTNRYRAQMWGEGNDEKKEIIRCTYIDEEYPFTDKIRVQLCGARNNQPANYFKTRKVKIGKWEQLYNKTIFEFNHEFLTSIKLYDPKVIVAEIVEYLFGEGNMSVSIGLSWNEQMIDAKIQTIIANILKEDDLGVEDCYFSFSNDEFNEMLEQAERNRYNVHKVGDKYSEIDTTEILNQLNDITSESTLNEDLTTIQRTLNAAQVTPAQDASTDGSTLNLNFDWKFELLRALAYPFIRPLFTPKVIFLFMVNKKIMGSIDDEINADSIVEDLTNGLIWIIKDIIVKLKDMLVDMLLSWVLKKLTPLLALFAARMLLEALQMYKDLLFEIFNACKLSIWNPFGMNNGIKSEIDDVNYADIKVESQTPEEIRC